MGLFGKLAKDILRQVMNDGTDSRYERNNNHSQQEYENSYSPEPTYPKGMNTGCSWGDIMPDEENQYNFDGKYYEYFEKIYNEEFPQYNITYDKLTNRNATIFTFRSGNTPVLYVELLSSKSSAKKFRAECAKYGIAYLRFYFDKHDWWNTRSYVIMRTKMALGL